MHEIVLKSSDNIGRKFRAVSLGGAAASTNPLASPLNQTAEFCMGRWDRNVEEFTTPTFTTFFYGWQLETGNSSFLATTDIISGAAAPRLCDFWLRDAEIFYLHVYDFLLHFVSIHSVVF